MYCVVGFRSLAPVHRGWTANAQFNRCSYTISINGIQLVRHGIYEPSAIHCPTDLTNFETCIAPTAHIRENHPLFIVAAAGDLVSTAEKLYSDGKKTQTHWVENVPIFCCCHFSSHLWACGRTHIDMIVRFRRVLWFPLTPSVCRRIACLLTL